MSYSYRSLFSYADSHVENDAEIRFDKLQIIRHGRLCKYAEKEVHLTPKEFAMLWQLCKADGQIVSAEKLYAVVWDEPFYAECSNTIMVHMRHVRQKLAQITEGHISIKTIWGMGYRLERGL